MESRSARVHEYSNVGNINGSVSTQRAYERKDCRLCGGVVETKLKLKDTPIANAFQDNPGEAQKYPLELAQCINCEHVQLKHVIPDSIIFSPNYYYRTPEANLEYLARQAKNLYSMAKGKHSALEIGANNGLFLNALSDAGFKQVYGVDPAGTGTVFWKEPFTSEFARKIRRRGKMDVVVANNVFAHIDNLEDVFDGIDYILSDFGLLVFEVQYFKDLSDNGLFDMIYHEHRDYHTINPLLRFCIKKGLWANHVEIIPNHGGSIRFYCSRDNYSAYPRDESIDWDLFKSKVAKTCSKEVKPGTVLFGAPAKATTLLHNMDCIDKIAFCVDDTYGKQGKYIPGTEIKIYPSSKLDGFKGDVLLASWNYKDVIQKRFPDLTLINPHE